MFNLTLQKPVEIIPIYAICRFILAFRLVLTYDLLEDRRIGDVIGIFSLLYETVLSYRMSVQ